MEDSVISKIKSRVPSLKTINERAKDKHNHIFYPLPITSAPCTLSSLIPPFPQSGIYKRKSEDSLGPNYKNI